LCESDLFTYNKGRKSAHYVAGRHDHKAAVSRQRTTTENNNRRSYCNDGRQVQDDETRKPND